MPTLDVQIKQPVTIVILGATGDLTRRKLMPALYTLFKDGVLNENFAVIGFARREHDDSGFCALIAEALREHCRTPLDEESLAAFCSHLHYHKADIADINAYTRLKERFNHKVLPENRLFYLSITPDLIETATHNLCETGLITPPDSSPWSRVVVEKPFGHDLRSAQTLNRILLEHMDETQIYRIDHYLGKETVQNILSFRFANTIFEPVFNRTHVDHIQITAAETIGMESGRGAFYDKTGALRDMVANHLFQLLCLVTMEPPDGLEARSIRNEKMKILRALTLAPPVKEHPSVSCGQYAGNATSPAFRDEERVAADSRTETYIALRMGINNWRWADVPIYLRTGKRLPKKTTEIAVQFKTPPLSLFQHVACRGDVCDLTGVKPNTLIFRIQPDEGIFLQISAKRPAMQLLVESVDMDFSYSGKWEKELPEAYERLLLDAMRGDSTLFTRSDEVEAEWEVIDTIVSNTSECTPSSYPSGSWGPPTADAILLSNAWRVTPEPSTGEKRDK